MADFERIEHVAIAVVDAEAAVAHFAALGFEVARVEDVSGGMRSHILTSGDIAIEILASTEETSGLARFLDRRGEGLHHLCLGVGSLERAMAVVGEAGCSLVNDRPSLDSDGQRVFVHPATNHGVLMGMVEQLVKPGARIVDVPWAEFADKTYSPAAAKGGEVVAVSGLNALDESGVIQYEGDITGQAKVIYEKLGEVLKAAGARPIDVIKTTDYLTTRHGYRGTAEVRKEFFGDHKPAATGVVVAELLGKGVLIEIDSLAVV